MFRCEKFRDYLKLNLLTDVCLLGDMNEAYCATNKEAHNFDPTYFVSAHHLAFNALLWYIKRPIELTSDEGIYQLIHPAVRGGICHASVRFVRANNNYMGSRFQLE